MYRDPIFLRNSILSTDQNLRADCKRAMCQTIDPRIPTTLKFSMKAKHYSTGLRHEPLSGYHVPEKTRIMVNLWAIGRDKSTWSCPVMQLGLYTAEVALAWLLQSFTCELPHVAKPSELDMSDTFGLAAPQAMRLMAVPTSRFNCPL
ncbi:cytochrome P450 84A1 [Tanacetum coccineum]